MAMSEITTVPTAGETKPCKVCGEAIKKVARVCIHCNNYQDWRGRINVSSTILSLLIALGSVLTVAVPVLKSALTPLNSNLIFSFQGASERRLGILVTNGGERPGSVRLRGIFAINPADRDVLDARVQMIGPEYSAKVIDQGKSELLEFSYIFNKDDPRYPGSLPSKARCTLILTWTDFRGNTDATAMDLPCDNLYEFRKGIDEAILAGQQKLHGDPPPVSTPLPASGAR